MAPPPAGGIDHSAASTLYWRSWRDSPRDVALWRSSSRRAPSQVLFARGQHGALDEVPYYDDSLPMYRVRTRVEDKRRRSRLSVRVRADDPSPSGCGPRPLAPRPPRAPLTPVAAPPL